MIWRERRHGNVACVWSAAQIFNTRCLFGHFLCLNIIVTLFMRRSDYFSDVGWPDPQIEEEYDTGEIIFG